MSLVVIQCDGCRQRRTLAVRQAHEARLQLEGEGWTSHDGTRGRGHRQQRYDYCPRCQS